MTLENVKLEKKNAIAYVTIDRPGAQRVEHGHDAGLWQSQRPEGRQTDSRRYPHRRREGFVAGADINELSRKIS
jgi:hypothetical protein